jgi:hypothetical protein
MLNYYMKWQTTIGTSEIEKYQEVFQNLQPKILLKIYHYVIKAFNKIIYNKTAK